MDDTFTIDSIGTLYKALSEKDEIKAKALLILLLRSWLTDVSSFDPVSGCARNTSIVDLMDAVAKVAQDNTLVCETKDRIYRIVSHTKEAIQAIFDHSRDKILREHAMLPIHAAREIDSKSIQWLSRQPGRTLREKLSGKPYIKAVRRRTSVDTAENRLLKAFLFRLENILIERLDAITVTTGESSEELLVALQRWFRSDDAAEIGAWGNLPPNNTLLQDKRYRKVWDGWLWLQRIDEHIMADSKRVPRDVLRVIYWNTLSLLNHTGRFRTVQQPVCLDYDNFYIVPELSAPELSVRGYLFPDNLDTKLVGRIDRLVTDRGFGFIDGCFFHASDLKEGLRFDELIIGEQLLFVVEETSKGKCAKRLEQEVHAYPKQVTFELSNEQIDIVADKETISVRIDAGLVVLTQKNKNINKKFKIDPVTLREIPKAILSLTTGSPFENFKPVNNQDALMRMDSSVVDLCSIRPKFTKNNGYQAYLPFRLLQQHWPLNVNGGMDIDCGYAKAIALRPDIETVSMRSLFLHNSTISDAAKSNASMFFTKKLSDYIKADKLTYLVPDWGNDFDLEGIRKSVNLYFEDSRPLPKSIAAIFAWQSSKKFVQDKVRENDFVLVVDSFDGGISITPVQAIYQKKLSAILPETQGVSWERHPTVFVAKRNIHTAMAHNLTEDGCQVSEELIQLFGFEGLANEAGEVSFVKDEHWYHLPSSIRETLSQGLELDALSNHTIDECLNSTNRDCRKVNVFILPLEDTIKKPDLRKGYKWLGSSWSSIKGSQTLNGWQEEVDDIALWRDHLPDLSIKIPRNGRFENFYLVKDAMVTPQCGRTVAITVEESFTLPAGQTHYIFPLQQGEGNKELQFVAYLKSPAFPLKESMECKLKMTYTYGADDPYELKFIPLNSDKAGFKSIRVEWRTASVGETVNLENMPVPDFPARKNWSDFQKFPKEDGTNFSDLLDWCCSKLAVLDELLSFDSELEYQNVLNKRKVGYMDWGTHDRKGKYYCRVNVGEDSVFCHSSQFIEQVDEKSLYEGCPVYLDVLTKDKGLSGSNVSFSENAPLRLQEKVQGDINLKLSRMMEFIQKGIFSLRFPALTIWNHGHSLSESDVPDHFRNSILEGVQKSLLIIGTENVPSTLKEELFFFLSCLHKDAPEIVGTRLLDAVQDGQLLKKNNKNIAYAIGDGELPWQQQLLRNIISPIDKEGLIRSITLEDLAIALWRSEKLIFKLSETDLKKLCNELFKCMQFDMQSLKSAIPKHRMQFHFKKGLSELEAQNRERSYQTNTLCKHMELLLALLRSRGSKDEKFKMILAPNKDLSKKYVTLIDDISSIVIDSDIALKSRISLQIEKPEMFNNTPDLLYALRMYLSGDSGANTIIITKVVDEN